VRGGINIDSNSVFTESEISEELPYNENTYLLTNPKGNVNLENVKGVCLFKE
jgi:hypothetical protein